GEVPTAIPRAASAWSSRPRADGHDANGRTPTRTRVVGGAAREMTMTTLTLGEVTVDSVVEIDRSSFPTPSMLPESTADGVARHRSWLEPFLDERTGDIGSRIQTFVVRTPRHLILIDTCVGNDKPREEVAVWHRRKGPWLDDLAALGVRPEQVDLVVCTHLHIDHVGWNTRLVDGRWIPTCPNATYQFAGEDWEYWRHEGHACVAAKAAPIVS